MTLIIDLPDEEIAALAAKAKAQGVSAEQYVKLVLEQDLKADSPRQSLSKAIREIWSGMPAEVQDCLPSDGASQVDHYVYGLPKSDH